MRQFTPDEANALVPRLQPLVEAMVERKRRLDAAEAARAQLLGRIATDGGDITPGDVASVARQVEEATGAVARLVDEIQSHGVQVKDLDVGLLDFPSVRDGKSVLLCWRLDEDEVAFWHGTDEGYAGRKPL